MTPAERVAADLTYLADRYEDFHEARLRGTARPWQQPNLTPESQTKNDRLAMVERAERSWDAIGEHPAPLHLDVMDALVDLLATAHDIEERVSQEAGVDRLPYPTSAMADPVPYLRQAVAHLQSVGWELLDYVGAEARRLRSDVDRHLGELTAGQKLLTECPWCRGVTASHPGGGDFTLRVRIAEDGHWLIVCESGGCEPPEADCGLRHRGHPAWDLVNEGAWLADYIEAVKREAA